MPSLLCRASDHSAADRTWPSSSRIGTCPGLHNLVAMPCCGWTKPCTTLKPWLKPQRLLFFTGESSFQGFLGGAKWISSIHSRSPLHVRFPPPSPTEEPQPPALEEYPHKVHLDYTRGPATSEEIHIYIYTYTHDYTCGCFLK